MEEVCELVAWYAAGGWGAGRSPAAVRVRLLLQEERLAGRGGFWVVVVGLIGIVGGRGHVGLHS